MAIDTTARHIEATPGILGGKPRIAGHRISVQDIVIWHDRLGKTADEIATEYGLSLSDVYAALTYYFDHRGDIDRDMEESRAYVDALRQSIPPKLHRTVEG